MCLGVCFLGSNFFGTFWASWTSWKSIPYARLGEFFSIFANMFSICCSCSYPSGTSIIQMLVSLKLSWRFLSLSSVFLIFVSSFCSTWTFIYSLCSKLLIWVPISFPSVLVPCIFSFIFLYIAFTFSSVLRPNSTISVSVLITSILNSASDKLALSSSLSSLFLEFWFVL